VIAAIALVLLAFVLMEPLTALTHRFVMHRFGMGWHRSHHEPPKGALEANDLFPVVFSIATIGLLTVGVYVGGGDVLVPLGIGITLYGASYLFVHDLVIHRRLGRWPPDLRERVRRARDRGWPGRRGKRRPRRDK